MQEFGEKNLRARKCKKSSPRKFRAQRPAEKQPTVPKNSRNNTVAMHENSSLMDREKKR